MDESSLRELSYKQLQSLASRYQVPGNIKKDIMVKVILAAYHDDHNEVCRILSGIQHTRKKRFKHLKNFNGNMLQVSPHPVSSKQPRAVQASPISWASKLELSSVKTPMHHYLIQHYQNTFLNTFPPAAPSPILLPPTSLPAILPLPPMNSLPPALPDSWLPQSPIIDLRIDQSNDLVPLDLQRKTLLITHTQTSQYPGSSQECSVLKQLLQPIKNVNSREVYDSDTMTAVTDSNDETSTDENVYPSSYEPPPYTSPLPPMPLLPSNSLQTQLISTDFWNYQSSTHQVESELEITAYDPTVKDNYNNCEYNYTQNVYDDANTFYSQPERSVSVYQSNENRTDVNYDCENYINNTNTYNFNESNEDMNLSNNYMGVNVTDDSINYGGYYKTKDCLINNNAGSVNEPLKDLMNYSPHGWSYSKPTEKSVSATSVESYGEIRDENTSINGQLESILNIRDVCDVNEMNEKIGQTSSVYCYATPVTSPRSEEGGKKRNFQLIAETRSQLFGIKYKVYDDSSTGRAMSHFD